MSWHYEISGFDARKQAWSSSGEFEAEGLDIAIATARRMSFRQLTEGKARLGNPGKGGCTGPYDIIAMLIVRRRT